MPACSARPAKRKANQSAYAANAENHPSGVSMLGLTTFHLHNRQSACSKADQLRRAPEIHQDAALKSSPWKLMVMPSSACTSCACSIAVLRAHFCA